MGMGSKKRVQAFVETITKRGQARVQQRTSDGDAYFIVNYDTYQCNGDAKGGASGYADGDSNGDAGGYKREAYKANKTDNAKAAAPAAAKAKSGRADRGPDADELAKQRAVLAPLTREKLWLGKNPPPNILLSHPDWDMGRDLSICHSLMRTARIGLDEMAGVIGVARSTLSFEQGEALTMLIFNVRGQGDRLNDCLRAYQKQREREEPPTGILELLRAS